MVRNDQLAVSTIAASREDEVFAAAVAPLAAVPTRTNGSEATAQSVVLVDVAGGMLARRAAEDGIESALVKAETLEWAINRALDQVLELQKLRATYRRVRLIERAKGVLMERHRFSEPEAYELLHRQARNSNLRLSEMAQAVVDSHLLLRSEPPSAELY